MIEITTRSSISVNPSFDFDRLVTLRAMNLLSIALTFIRASRRFAVPA